MQDKEVFDFFERASDAEREQFPDALASFYAMLSVSKVSKSAESYMQQVKMLMERFQLSLDAMMSEEFLNKVKRSKENVKRNNLIAAGLKKFQDFMTLKAATPWEAKT